MIIGIVDKIIFGVLLVLSFQVPVLSDQYLQYVSGYFDSSQSQIDGFEENARLHEYRDIYAMIDDFLNNTTLAVRYDGQQKLQALREYEELKEAVEILQSNNIFKKVWFIFNPSRWGSLEAVMGNFTPAIPLKIWDIIFSALLALVFSAFFMWPVKAVFKGIKSKKKTSQ